MHKPKISWNLGTKWALAYSILIILISGIMSYSLFWQLQTVQREALRGRLLDIVNFSAPQVDGGFHSLIRTPVDDSNSFYRVISLRLKAIKETSEIIDHIYTLRQQEDGHLTYVVDTDLVNPAVVGQVYQRSSPILSGNLSALTGPVIEQDLYSDDSGIHLSGYAPILDQFGEMDGILVIDINAAPLMQNEVRARRTALAAFLTTLPLSLLLGWWLARFLNSPVNALLKGAQRVAQGNLDETVPIISKDELGVLAATFNHMTTQLRQTLSGLEKEIADNKRNNKVQDVTYRISQAVISTNSIDELYSSIHTLLGELISVENFYIAIYEPTKELISFPYYIDQYDKQPLPLKPGEGLTGLVLHTGKPLLITSEVFSNLIQQGKVEQVGAEPVDWLGAPLKVEGRTIGAVVVQSYSEEIRFNQEDLNLMEFVSSQIALAIDHKRAAEMLHQSNERYRGLFEDSPISLWEEDFSAVKKILDSLKRQGVTEFPAYLACHPEVVAECAQSVHVVDVNKATLLLFGATSKEEMLKNLTTVFRDESYALFQDELSRIAEGQTNFSWDGVNQTLDGKRIEVNINWSVVPGYEADLSKVVISMIDITERQKAELKLKHMSTHDALTGLYNRAFFDQEMDRLETEHLYPVSIVMADLDNLKGTNDRYGHAAGDELLRQAAKVLKEAFRAEDVVARIGGDEFAVLLPNSSTTAVEKALQRIRDNIKAQNCAHTELPLHLSLGASTAEETDLLHDTLRQADANMYLEKQDKH
jgi:diguanylate cyclase (GGDEF)-like protein/PAS domain S-box-containing protein